MLHPPTRRSGAPAHLHIVRAPAGESPFDTAEPEPARPAGADVVHLRPRHTPPRVDGSLALAPVACAPAPRPTLRLIVTPQEPDPAEARLRAQRLAHSLAEIVSGLRTVTQLRPYASAAVYKNVQQLTRTLTDRRVGRVRVRSSNGRAPADGVAEGYARLHAETLALTVAFRLERDAPTPRPTTTWLCTALEHDRLR
ncbi:Rv3235 family protein [Streptomyces sp. SID3343]|uniref:Rv3235 family protein n=1 Tax=Streptomyces sp. SID3343 TaxID=2690260 RepID=UPI00136EE40B|nr:Rv3235 family protein [Streptomyces sp. SID3343]MYW00658.1 hypothetical protein [Streptomyces sp. SID3343]